LALPSCSFLGWEDLDVVDPDAEKAGKGKEGTRDEGLYQTVSSKSLQQVNHLGVPVVSVLLQHRIDLGWVKVIMCS
jgi:hypothetical protein